MSVDPTIEDFWQICNARKRTQSNHACCNRAVTTIASVQQKVKRNLAVDLRPFINLSGKRHNQSAIASHGCDEPASSMRVTFTSARRRVHRHRPSALPSTAATNVHATLDVDAACVNAKTSHPPSGIQIQPK
jgi:hypothetical protein